LILALLYVGYAVVVHGAASNVAVASTFGFLWYWHLTWTVVWGVIVGLIFLIGLLVTVGGKDGSTKGYGLLASFVVGPLLAFGIGLRQALFLGSVAILMKAGIGPEGPLTWDKWNVAYLVIAGLMYVVAILVQRNTVTTTKSSNS
jgi:hypothetical protein